MLLDFEEPRIALLGLVIDQLPTGENHKRFAHLLDAAFVDRGVTDTRHAVFHQ